MSDLRARPSINPINFEPIGSEYVGRTEKREICRINHQTQ